MTESRLNLKAVFASLKLGELLTAVNRTIIAPIVLLLDLTDHTA
jgi:hypothetical protein